jgi:hypothetical protein
MYDRVNEEAHRLDTTRSEIIREALDRYFEVDPKRREVAVRLPFRHGNTDNAISEALFRAIVSGGDLVFVCADDRTAERVTKRVEELSNSFKFEIIVTNESS